MKRLAGMILLVGCSATGGDVVGTRQSALALDNGMSLNGMSLNGMSLNGMSLNGMSLNGMSLNGMSLNGMSLNGMSLNGGELTGVLTNGQRVSGIGMIGVTMVGFLSSGSKVSLRIDDVVQEPAPNTDVFQYFVSIQADDGWHPLCGDATLPAIAMAGVWDYSQGTRWGGSWIDNRREFTFSCPTGAITKCVNLGYKPWLPMPTSHRGGGSGGFNFGNTGGDDNDHHNLWGGVGRFHKTLRDYHQTCTRVIRADYCGNGTSFTANNREINIYDGIGIQTDTENWEFEAEWEPDGAACISNTRLSQIQQQGGDPACFHAEITASCGDKSHFTTSDTLIMDEFNANQ